MGAFVFRSEVMLSPGAMELKSAMERCFEDMVFTLTTRESPLNEEIPDEFLLARVSANPAMALRRLAVTSSAVVLLEAMELA